MINKSNKKFPFYRQLDQKDCGPTCLRMISKFYGQSYGREVLRRKTFITKQGVTLAGIAEAAESIGFRSLGLRVKPEILFDKIPKPCIVPWRQKHFIVVTKVTKKKVVVADPAFGIVKYSKAEFLDGWFNGVAQESNFALVLDPTPNFYSRNEEIDDKKKSGFRLLLPYFKSHKRILFQVFLGLCIGILLQFAMPFLLQSIIDYGVNYQDIGFIYLILIAQIVLYLSSTSIQIIRSWLILHMSSRINIKMISDFLLKILNLPLSYFETRNMGEHMQRIRDHTRVQNFLSGTTLATAFSFITLIIFTLILFYYNTLIFIVFIIGSILFVTWSLLFLKQREILDFKRIDKLSDNDSSLVEIINGVYEIKTNNSKLKQRWKWEKIQIELFKLSLKSLGLSQSQIIGASTINELKNIAVTFIAAKSVIEGSITLGMMVSIQYIIGQLNGPLNGFITFLQSSQDAKLSLDRLSQIHNKKDEDGANNLKLRKEILNKSIIINDLWYRYGGKSSPFVLKNINITIPEGKTTAIVGASGSGKTTLMKLLLKFITPTKGNIKVDHMDLENMHSDYWRSQCGAVLQQGFIFGDSIGGNIAESEQSGIIDRERLLNAAYVANIAEFIENLPNGYDTLIGHSGIRMSGGQQQRIFIARAIYKSPSYLFFDEATSSLDASNEKVIVDRLNKELEHKTVVVIAHRLSTVRNADQIIVLDKGEIVEIGNHEELSQRKGIYYELVKNQLELGN